MTEYIMYHITKRVNLKDILRDGLIPQIGKRSLKINEKVDTIYLFPSLVEVENALMNWLGEEFEEEEEIGESIPISLLKVKLTECVKLMEWEIVSYKIIEPSNIIVLADDINCIDFRELYKLELVNQ